PTIQLLDSTPSQLINFLNARDESGNTQYHNCVHAGTAGAGRRVIKVCKRSCPNPYNCPHRQGSQSTIVCPIGLAPTTVKAMIGSIARYFSSNGRTEKWTVGLQNENPAIHPMISSFITDRESKATESLISPIQAVPLFEDQVELLVTYMRNELSPTTPLYQAVRILQRIAFILLLQKSGKRPADVARIHYTMAMYTPNKTGAFFFLFFHKTSAKSGICRFIIPNDDSKPEFCAIKALEKYIQAMKQFHYPFQNAKLLFPNLDILHDASKPYLHHTRNSHIDHKKLNRDVGVIAKTLGFEFNVKLYGMRVSAAITARALDNKEELFRTMESGGWKTQANALHYSQYFTAVKLAKSGASSIQISRWIANPSPYRMVQ
ncbi:hypothetical protein HDU79_001241, partial [Rhizoclosmatium sp. JEL0117]